MTSRGIISRLRLRPNVFQSSRRSKPPGAAEYNVNEMQDVILASDSNFSDRLGCEVYFGEVPGRHLDD